jgi:type I restriction enzyme S subunit
VSNAKKSRITKEQPQSALMPRLRFPEFRDGQAWKPQFLGRLFSQREEIGRTDLRLLSLMDKEGIIPQEHSNRKNNASADLTKYLRVAPGDIAYNTMRMWEGRSALSNLEGIVSPAYTICRPEPEVNSLFFSYYFRTPQLVAEFARYSQGLVKDTLNLKFEAFARILAATPCDMTEQQKIADCLTSIDTLIAAQARKVDALKTHKQGLMQQLFPRKGQTHPRLRFPQFRDAGEWHERRLEELAKRGSGHTPSKSKAEYYNGDIKWVSLADSSRLDQGFISDTKIQISEKGIRNSSAVLHQAGTVLISRDAGIGKSAVMKEPMAVSQHFIVWTCKPSFLSNWFLYHLLQNSKPLFEQMATGSTIKTIGLPFFVDLKFQIPSLPEQHRIADCLNSLDRLITAEIQKLEALRSHKKGQMQQLFPSAEEVES